MQHASFQLDVLPMMHSCLEGAGTYASLQDAQGSDTVGGLSKRLHLVQACWSLPLDGLAHAVHHASCKFHTAQTRHHHKTAASQRNAGRTVDGLPRRLRLQPDLQGVKGVAHKRDDDATCSAQVSDHHDALACLVHGWRQQTYRRCHAQVSADHDNAVCLVQVQVSAKHDTCRMSCLSTQVHRQQTHRRCRPPRLARPWQCPASLASWRTPCWPRSVPLCRLPASLQPHCTEPFPCSLPSMLKAVLQMSMSAPCCSRLPAGADQVSTGLIRLGRWIC